MTTASIAGYFPHFSSRMPHGFANRRLLPHVQYRAAMAAGRDSAFIVGQARAAATHYVFAAFTVSDASDYSNGQLIELGGGSTAVRPRATAG